MTERSELPQVLNRAVPVLDQVLNRAVPVLDQVLFFGCDSLLDIRISMKFLYRIV